MRHSELPSPLRLSSLCRALCILLAAAVPFGSQADAIPETLAADAVKPGQIGIGYCTIKGTQVDSFRVEILGVQHDVLYPGRDVILARLSGANLEETGLFHGMSGSPVFIDGKLIGAVAHGWGFAAEPICGITPIGDMLEILDKDLSGPNEHPATIAPLGAAGDPAPLPLPVWVSGVGRGAREFLADVLEPTGLIPVAGVGGSAPIPEQPASPLRPGSSVGVQMIRGDMAMTSIGTVTWIEGDSVIAFGHPFMGIGAVDMPMTRTTIHGVLPSHYSSFVLGSATESIGALRQDRASGVAGILGAEARMLPVVVAVESAESTRILQTEVLHHSLLSSSLAQIVVFSALESQQRLLGVASLEVKLNVLLTDGRRMAWNQVFSGLHAPLLAARSVGGPLASLVWSGLEDIQLEHVRVDISIRDQMHVAEIGAVRHEPQHPRPGESISLQVELDPFQGPAQQLTIDLTLPESAEGLPIRLLIGNGSSALAWAQERQSDMPVRDSDELLVRLQRQRRDDELVIEVVADTQDLALDGRPMQSLPASVGRLLQQTPSVGRVGSVSGRVLHQQRLRVPFVLEGERVIDLGRVKR